MKLFKGDWKGHEISVENSTSTEKVYLDGKLVAESKPGIRMSSEFLFDRPETDEKCFVVISGAGGSFTAGVCYCIIGTPLETEYDSKTKTYSAEFGGHKVEAVNKMTSVLLVDGEEVDREPKGLHFIGLRGSKADENGKRFLALFNGSAGAGLKVKCDVFGGAEIVRMRLYDKKGDEFVLNEKYDKHIKFSFEE